jgi:hypothetical protein
MAYMPQEIGTTRTCVACGKVVEIERDGKLARMRAH